MLTDFFPGPIDYLVIGHLTADLTLEGPALGGTASYAALTAQALGLRVGIVTAVGGEVSLEPLAELPVAGIRAEQSTTYENIQTQAGRMQIVHYIAPPLALHMVPPAWKEAPIVHLGPVANEIDLSFLRAFQQNQLVLTPQGWLRGFERTGKVYAAEWPEAAFVLQKARATVISLEDIEGDESRLEEMAAACHVLVVTEAANGARLYWNGDIYHEPAPEMDAVSTVGAGDIFAAAFFTHLHATHDPLSALHFATHLASLSVTREGLASIPTPEEIQACLMSV